MNTFLRFVVIAALSVPGVVHAGLGTWTQISDPIEGTDHYQRVVTGNNYLFVSVNDSLQTPIGLFKREHAPPSEWESLNFSSPTWGLAVAGTQDEHVMVSTMNGEVWYSADGGETWVDRTNGLPPGGFVDRVVVRESGYAYATMRGADPGFLNGVARSLDFGVSWEFSEWCEGKCFFGGFLEIVADETQPEKAWANFVDGFFQMQVARTEDGLLWEDVQMPWYDGFASMGLEQDKILNDRFFYMLSDRIWWFDGVDITGETILPILSGGNNMGLAVPAWDPGAIYGAGRTSAGAKVFRSQDPYTSWSPVSEGLPAVAVPHPANKPFKYALEAVPNQPKLYLVVWGLGLFERDVVLDPADVAEQQSPVGLSASLFPNPSEGRVEWTISLMEPTEIEILVVNAVGQRVLRRAPEFMARGGHNIGALLQAEIRDLPSGAYYLSVRSQGETLWSRRLSIIQ